MTPMGCLSRSEMKDIAASPLPIFMTQRPQNNNTENRTTGRKIIEQTCVSYREQKGNNIGFHIML